MSPEAEDRTARLLAPSVDSTLGTKLLPGVLSVIAGSVDVISFLGLGLFTAHITGNLAVLAAHVASGGDTPLAAMLSVPVFMAVLALTEQLGGGPGADGGRLLQAFLLFADSLIPGELFVSESV